MEDDSRAGSSSVQRFNTEQQPPPATRHLSTLLVQVTMTGTRSRVQGTAQRWLKQEKVKVGFGGLALLVVVVHNGDTARLSSWQCHGEALREAETNHTAELLGLDSLPSLTGGILGSGDLGAASLDSLVIIQIDLLYNLLLLFSLSFFLFNFSDIL